MTLFRIADKKLAEIRFIKVEDHSAIVTYRRVNKKLGYTQCLKFLRKADSHVVQSYDCELHDRKRAGNMCVGLTAYEMELCIRKMRELGWKIDEPKRRKKKCAN